MFGGLVVMVVVCRLFVLRVVWLFDCFAVCVCLFDCLFGCVIGFVDWCWFDCWVLFVGLLWFVYGYLCGWWLLITLRCSLFGGVIFMVVYLCLRCFVFWFSCFMDGCYAGWCLWFAVWWLVLLCFECGLFD